MEEKKVKSNPKALFPIALFLVLYLGNGVFFEYIKPQEGQMGFYVVSVVLAFSIALIAAFLQNRKLSFDEKIHICAKGIGDDNIVIMLFIFLMAGGFSGIASQAGGASSTANMLLNVIPGKYAVPGLFLISCLISMAMGTSVGTISVLAPIACAVSKNGGLPLELCVGVVVGGAMFGDNLSFISDTTIAATKTQGVEMKDKFFTNIRVALPSAVITFIILIVYAVMKKGVDVGIAVCAMRLFSRYDVIVLSAGDGDFEDFIRYIVEDNDKQLYIAGFDGNISSDLQQFSSANYLLDEHYDEVSNDRVIKPFDGVDDLE